jgi:hypothetical protein
MNTGGGSVFHRQRWVIFRATLTQAFLQLGLINTDDLPSLACDLMLSGMESEPLLLLASLSPKPNPFEALDLFEKVLRAEGLKPLAEIEAAAISARRMAAEIVEGAVPPHEGARWIWLEIWSRFDHPPELVDFVVLADRMDEMSPRELMQLGSEVETEIVKAAAELLQKEDLQLGTSKATQNGG